MLKRGRLLNRSLSEAVESLCEQRPDKDAYAELLRACGEARSLAHGRRVHASIQSRGMEWHSFLQSHLVQMYLRCGSLADASDVFDTVVCPNVVLCTMIVGAFGNARNFERSRQAFCGMLLDGTRPDPAALVTMLSAAGTSSSRQWVRKIHDLAVECRLLNATAVGSALVNMYGRCGCIEEARSAFDAMPSRDVLSWNALVAAYASNGHCTEASWALRSLLLDGGPAPNRNTFVVFLNGCEGPAMLHHGRLVHAIAQEAGFQADPLVGTALVNMYGYCGSAEEALAVFEESEQRDVIMWTAAITAAGFLGCDGGELVMQLFKQMQLDGVIPDVVTIVNVLNACVFPGDLQQGRAIHAIAAEQGFDCNVVVGNSMITMYNKCGSVGEARYFFDSMLDRDMISWNAMLAAYTTRGQARLAMQLFHRLLYDGLVPNRACFVTMLSGFATAAAGAHEPVGNPRSFLLESGKLVHRIIQETGHDSFTNVCNSLVNMYGSCGSLDDSDIVFNVMEPSSRDLVSWNATITLHSQQAGSSSGKAIHLYRQLQLQGLKPNSITFLAVLTACTNQGASRTGKLVHSHITESSSCRELEVQNALVNMYGKCGKVETARWLFDRLPGKGEVSWNGMLVGYSQHGQNREAMLLFLDMLLEGVYANEVTFVAVLSACSHAGMLEEGCSWFRAMMFDFGIQPVLEHFGCMVDLLARAGWLSEAFEWTGSGSDKGGLSGDTKLSCFKSWLSLLNACKIHGEVNLAGQVAEQVIRLEPQTSAGYIMLANVYA